MDFTHVEFPSTVDLNAFKAYFSLSDVKLPNIYGKPLQDSVYDSVDVSSANQVKSLRHLVLDTLIENWNENPVYAEIPRQEDRNYIVSNIEVNLKLETLAAHIRDDFFWRKCYQQRWRSHQTPTAAKLWLNMYMERHLEEFIENVKTCDYDVEGVQATLDICAAYINQLEINYLQPAMDGRNDHIPLDFILSNLPELHTLRLTYCTRTVGRNFYLGCNMLSHSDTIYLGRGVSRCHELLNFCMHSTKLAPYQLGVIARSLDKGCHNLTSLSLVHCTLGDAGIREFIEACNQESFITLKSLDLTNNNISPDGAFALSRALRFLALDQLVVRLNPIRSDGAAALFSVLPFLPITLLDISGCSLCVGITKLFMGLIIQNKTLFHLDVSNNHLGEEFGKHIFKIIGFNKTVKQIDLRNTGLSMAMRNKLKEILQTNTIRAKRDQIKTNTCFRPGSNRGPSAC